MAMNFHKSVLKLLESELSRSPEAVLEISRLENELGLVLPTAVKQWYQFAVATSVMLDYSNQDHPISLPEFEVKPTKEFGPIIPFMVENQGVCTWGFCLDQTEDPAVVVQVDNGPWQHCADHFSVFIECLVKDGPLIKEAHFAAQASPLTNKDLSNLRARFEEYVQTYNWPGKANYRFVGPKMKILIWAGEQQADW